MHFIGRYGDEATLYRLAAQLEGAKPWFARMAPVAGGKLGENWGNGEN
jgi:amidase